MAKEIEKKDKARLWKFDGQRGRKISKRLSRKHIRRENKRIIDNSQYEPER